MKANIQKIFGFRIFQYLAAITGNIGVIACEMHYGWTSPAIPQLVNGDYKIKINSEKASWLVLVLLVGTIIGALITGSVAESFGRKKIILFTTVPIFAGWLTIGFSKTLVELLLGRMIAGVAVGISFTVIPMYLGEISDPDIRGLLSSVCPIFVVLGLFITNFIGNMLPINVAAFVCLIFPILLVTTFIWMPESPKFLMRKGKWEEAKENLHVLLGTDAGDIELSRLEIEINSNVVTYKGYKYLFTDEINRKALLIALGLRTIQQLCGSAVMTFYCKTVFEEAKDFLSPETSTNIYFGLQLLIATFVSFIVDSVGRKPLLLMSLIGTSAALLTTGVYLHLKTFTYINMNNFNYVPVISLIMYVFFLNCGLRTIPLLMVGEIFSSEIKAVAVSFAAIYFSILSIIISKFFHLTSEHFGMYVPFYSFSVTCLLGIYLILFHIPETKGKTLEEIQRELYKSESNIIHIKTTPIEDSENL